MPESSRVSVEHQHVSGADYSGRTYDQFASRGSTFTGCRFDKARLKDAGLGVGTEVSRYLGCSFDGTYLTALGGFARFEDCGFRNVRVTRSSPDYLEFVDCTFEGTITGLQLWGAPQDGANLHAVLTTSYARDGSPPPDGLEDLLLRPRNEIAGNDFGAAQLVGVNFRFGVDLTAQKLPAGDDYLYLPHAEAALTRALERLDPETSEDVARARRWLQALLDREVRMGQRQLFLRPRDYETRGTVKPHVNLAVDALRTT